MKQELDCGTRLHDLRKQLQCLESKWFRLFRPALETRIIDTTVAIMIEEKNLKAIRMKIMRRLL
jgi:hypothetical protein